MMPVLRRFGVCSTLLIPLPQPPAGLQRRAPTAPSRQSHQSSPLQPSQRSPQPMFSPAYLKANMRARKQDSKTAGPPVLTRLKPFCRSSCKLQSRLVRKDRQCTRSSEPKPQICQDKQRPARLKKWLQGVRAHFQRGSMCTSPPDLQSPLQQVSLELPCECSCCPLSSSDC